MNIRYQFITIFRYLKGSSALGITYGNTSYVNDRNKLITYSDSDWAGSPDSRRSISGYVIM